MKSQSWKFKESSLPLHHPVHSCFPNNHLMSFITFCWNSRASTTAMWWATSKTWHYTSHSHYRSSYQSTNLLPLSRMITCQQFEHMGIIRPSSSSWSSPLHMVSKKSPKDWCPCGDYCGLNRVTTLNNYPILHIHDFATTLHGTNIFLRLPLCGPTTRSPLSVRTFIKQQ